jgi:hypothetical protein
MIIRMQNGPIKKRLTNKYISLTDLPPILTLTLMLEAENMSETILIELSSAWWPEKIQCIYCCKSLKSYMVIMNL